MDDMKKTYREGEETAKENWRKADGHESVADALGNAGDDIRKELGNAGDDINREVKQGVDEDKAASRRSDGDESLADKAGNAGDAVRREVGDRWAPFCISNGPGMARAISCSRNAGSGESDSQSTFLSRAVSSSITADSAARSRTEAVGGSGAVGTSRPVGVSGADAAARRPLGFDDRSR